MTSSAVVLLAAVVLSVAACNTQNPTGDSGTSETSAPVASTGLAATELTGTFDGFFHFEAQCHYIKTADATYSLKTPPGFSVEPDGPWDPSSSEEADAVLHDAAGKVVANKGDNIVVTGTVEDLPPGGPCFTEQIFAAETITAP